MTRPFKFSALLLALCGFSGLSGPALAQSQLPAVDITALRAPLPRVDVAKVCPAIAQTLRRSLSLYPFAWDTPQDLLVRFDLRGGKVDTVGLKQTPIEIRQKIRRAMRTVDCLDDGQARQRFAFVIRVMPEGEGEAQVVALQSDSELLAEAGRDR